MHSVFANHARRKRRTWMFERLEDRFYLSATPLASVDDTQWVVISGSTLEGQQLIDQLNQAWLEGLSGASIGSDTVQLEPRAVPTDPYFPYQWNLFNVGQVVNYEGLQDIFGEPMEDINVVPVWQDGVTGEGVLVAVVDTGMFVAQPDVHPDLDDNISVYRYNALAGGTNVSPGTAAGAGHGTAVAGIIAAEGNNGEGIVGIAYGAEIMPIKLLPTSFADPPLTNLAISNALTANGAPVDVFNNSWGPSDETRVVDGPDAFLLGVLQSVATTGRNGLGSILVFASGNGAGPQFSPGFQDIGIWDSAGSDGYVNSRYTIGVGVVDHDGSVYNNDGSLTLYGEVGPSVLVVAPTGSFPFDYVSNPNTGSGLWTTDLLGEDGFNQDPLPNGQEIDGDPLPDTDYTSKFNGTSGSAPNVSGVIALMLDVNPNLSYRDVEEILVRSARQNDDYDSSWMTNRFPLFRDPISHLSSPDPNNDEIHWMLVPPDPMDPDGESTVARDPADAGYNPILDPRFTTLPPFLPTNGAGYTVSHGRMAQFASEYGYAHGVVDAELAVALAGQWSTKDQTLADELSYLVIPLTGSVPIQAAEVSSEETGMVRVPGALGRGDGFIDYFEEFLKEPEVLEGDPDAMPPTMDMIDPESLPFGELEDPPQNDRGSVITVAGPSGSNAMSIEWVEVQLDISGGGNDLDKLRIALESPSGVQSELTNYQLTSLEDAYQFTPVNLFVDPPGELDDDADENGTFSWIYSTNRDWGERGEGVWTLHFENYSDTEMSLDGVRIVFHGEPISIPGEQLTRIQGSIGIDAGRAVVGATLSGRNDGSFNFDRTVDFQYDAASGQLLPLNAYGGSDEYIERFATYLTSVYGSAHLDDQEIIQYFDPAQEPFAGNVTVIATDEFTGQVVAQFITGADGNFYFDLPAGEYELTIDDPEGRTALDGSDYASQWHVDTNPQPAPFIEIIDHVNFLLDPGSLPANQVVIEGQVYADVDGDGVRDPQDVGMPNFLAFADLNHTGQREASEPFVLTDGGGNYSLTIPTASYNTFTVGVEPLDGWDPTFPGPPNVGFQTQFADLGETVGGVDFGFSPPSTPTGEGDGWILGFVFDDVSGDGVFQPAFEEGAADIRVFIDAGDMNGVYDAGETYTYTTSSGPAQGSFQFSNLPTGTYRVDVDINLPLAVTAPAIGYRDIVVTEGEAKVNATFGVQNLAVNDYGDLVGPGFLTTAAEDGPRHLVVQGFALGSLVDAELDTSTIEGFPGGIPDPPNPALNAIGDDVYGVDDEDGVSVVGGFLRPGVNTFEVELLGVGGYLNAWVDLNDDGDFADTVDGISEHVIVDLHRNTGTHLLEIDTPMSLDGGADGQVAARFRWGSFGLDYFGSDTIGEVEDYLFEVKMPIPGDYDGSGYVDEDDYGLWRSTFGDAVAPGTGADGNADGLVNAADYALWRSHEGEGTPPGAGGGAGGSAGQQLVASTEASLSAPSSPVQSWNLDWSAILAAASPSSAVLAQLEQLGVTSVIVNGPNGPVVRYMLSSTSPASPATTAALNESAMSGLATGLDVSFDSLGTHRSHGSTRLRTGVDGRPDFSRASHPSRAASLSAARLRLLDYALCEITPAADNGNVDEGPLSFVATEHKPHMRELALATVFEEEDWCRRI